VENSGRAPLQGGPGQGLRSWRDLLQILFESSRPSHAGGGFKEAFFSDCGIADSGRNDAVRAEDGGKFSKACSASPENPEKKEFGGKLPLKVGSML